MDFLPIEMKPYENEHACRLRDPDNFQENSFRREKRKHNSKEYSVIMGKLKGEDTMTDQAYRYDKKRWSVEEAREHCKDHDGSFEAAKKVTHPHGEHICECPECGTEITVDENIKCNTQICPKCGARMRAQNIGERRSDMTNDIEHKSFIGIELKEDKPGSFVARIATLNVIDKDGDVTLPGAFPEGKTILISAYMHGSWMGELPVGKGIIHERGEDIVIEGEFNLNTETGKEHYETLKFTPDLSEWSYGFLVLELDEESEWNDNPKVWRVFKSLDVFEVSPVLRGAGINTALLAIKSVKDEGMTYADQAETVLAAVKDLVERTKSLADLRRNDGRDLSKASRAKVAELREAIETTLEELKALLELPEKSGDEGKEALLSLQKIYKELQEVMN